MDLTTTGNNISTEISAFIERRQHQSQDTRRTQALQHFRELGLPGPRHEEFKYTPLTRELQKHFTFRDTVAPASLDDISEFLIPGLDADVLVFINGVYSSRHSSPGLSSSALKIRNLQEALDERDEAALRHFNQLPAVGDAFAAWNAADWQAGVFVHIAEHAVQEKPLLFLYVHDATAGEVVTSHRNLVVAGKGSQCTIIEKFNSVGAGNHFGNLVTEIEVAEHAQVDFYSIQDDKGNRYQYNLTEIHQAQSSRVTTYTFNLQGTLLRNNLHLVIDGENIESHMYGLYLLGGSTLADNHTVVDHKKPNSFTNELYKGIIDDSAKGVFNGKIFVRPQAQKTNAFQANRNILLSEKATVNTKPQLEIWADDVKCSHGCTTGQLDEEALFYLRTRGIHKDAARAMMLYAFAGEVTDKIPHSVIKHFIDGLIAGKLQKSF